MVSPQAPLVIAHSGFPTQAHQLHQFSTLRFRHDWAQV